ncbi:PLP-dependent aminotransferase family protein [Deinococcus lacus]|uniref:PLP-dependent aminotransferase family protein n=1 Tax=Deinococcus lacus TaxID=392561 RepID=A0ABW1YDB4_9DEIO
MSGDFLNLGLGYPAAPLLPRQQLAEAAQHRFSQDDLYFLQYGDELGDPELRRELAAFLTQQYGCPVPQEQLMISGGISQALELVCDTLAQPGDTILTEATTYFLAPPIFAARGLNLVPCPLEASGSEGGPELAALEALVQQYRPRFLYTIPAHHNPTGLSQSEERRRQIAQLAERYGFTILADEVYQLLHFGPQSAPPYSCWVPGGQVISLGTFSKILAPGLRVGWIHARPETLERLAANPTLLSGGGMNPLGAALVSSVLERGMASGLRDLRARLAEQAQALSSALHEFSQAGQPLEGTRWSEPEGGYFTWLHLPPNCLPPHWPLRPSKPASAFIPACAFRSLATRPTRRGFVLPFIRRQSCKRPCAAWQKRRGNCGQQAKARSGWAAPRSATSAQADNPAGY